MDPQVPAPGYVTVVCVSCQQTIWAPGRYSFWCGREPPSEVYRHKCADGNIHPNINILMGVKNGAIQMPLVEAGAPGKVDIGSGMPYA
jgi:hypothetical protein